MGSSGMAGRSCSSDRSSRVNFTLDRTSFGSDTAVSNISILTINGSATKQYMAWVRLHVSDVTAQNSPYRGATLVEFMARTQVHIDGEFHAEQGSEVHIYLGTTYPDCSEGGYNSIALNESQASSTTHAKNGERSMQLQFAPPVVADRKMQVRPNPFQTELNITLPAESNGSMYVVDLIGKSLNSWKAFSGISSIDLSSLSNGPYQLVWRAADGTESVTIIKTS